MIEVNKYNFIYTRVIVILNILVTYIFNFMAGTELHPFEQVLGI
jgi:hypothetical protein